MAVLNTKPLNTTTLNTTGGLSTFTHTAVGVSHIRAPYTHTAVGARVSLAAYTHTATGKHRIVYQPYTHTAIGTCKAFGTFTHIATGKHSRAVIPVSHTAIGAHHLYVTYTHTAAGLARLRNTLSHTAIGKARIQGTFTHTAIGDAQMGLAHTHTAIGAHGIAQPNHLRVYRQGYRVADAALARYELYVGVDAMPDFEDVGQPVATSTTLPFDYVPTPPAPGLTAVLHTVVRIGNEYGLLDHNQHPELIEIDENGVEVLGPLTAPELLPPVLDGNEIGDLQAWARYTHAADRNPADTWELYAEIGVDPVVGVDTPVLTTAMGILPPAPLETHLRVGGLTQGGLYHVMVVARRGADDMYMQSGVLQITLAVSYDIEADNTSMFGGDVYEIKS